MRRKERVRFVPLTISGAHPMDRNRTRLGVTPLDDRIVPAGLDLTPAATYTLTNDWGSGYQGEIALVNDQGTSVKDWKLEFDFGRDIGSIWNAKVVSKVGSHYVLGPADYNKTLGAGATVSIGFTGTGGTATAKPAGYTLSWDDGSGTTPTPNPNPNPNPNPTPTTGSAVTFTVDSRWTGGFTATVAIKNTGTSTISGWTLGFSGAFGITNLWNGTLSGQTGAFSVKNASWNGVIAPGQTVTFGFQGSGTPTTPTDFVLNGSSTGGGTTTPTPPTPTPTPSISVANVTVTEPIQGTSASGWLSTVGSQIVDANGMPVRLAGVNWFGMETTNYSPHGLWTRGYKEMMDQMKQEGFNLIRLPFSQEAFQPGKVPNGIDFSKNADLQGLSAIQILDKIVAYAGEIGLRIMLDHHRSNAGNGPNDNGLWYTSQYSETAWINTWTMLAARYANNPTIVAADLNNEPHNGTWGTGGTNDWRLAAERAGNAILAVNPNWLIVVEGVANGPSGSYWWGGNLSAAGQYPVRLNVPGRLVYSPHDYPSTVYQQSWFSASNYPNNLPGVWDANWGYLYKQGIAPILLGEFGTKYQTTSDQVWLSKLVEYLGDTKPAGQNQGMSWTYWSWNPNSSDTGGILADDWRTINTAKVNVLDPIQYGMIPATPGSGSATVQATFAFTLSAASTTPVTVRYATADGTATAGSDYVATSGTLTFAPGQTTASVTVTVKADALAEADELFYLQLTDPSGATISVNRATGTIRNA